MYSGSARIFYPRIYTFSSIILNLTTYIYFTLVVSSVMSSCVGSVKFEFNLFSQGHPGRFTHYYNSRFIFTRCGRGRLKWLNDLLTQKAHDLFVLYLKASRKYNWTILIMNRVDGLSFRSNPDLLQRHKTSTNKYITLNYINI